MDRREFIGLGLAGVALAAGPARPVRLRVRDRVDAGASRRVVVVGRPSGRPPRTSG